MFCNIRISNEANFLCTYKIFYILQMQGMDTVVPKLHPFMLTQVH